VAFFNRATGDAETAVRAVRVSIAYRHRVTVDERETSQLLSTEFADIT